MGCISERNPSPICFGIPYLKKEASICIDLYNLSFTKQSVSGCIRLEVKLLFIHIKKIDLGCFTMPLNSLSAEQVTGLQTLVDSINIAQAERQHLG